MLTPDTNLRDFSEGFYLLNLSFLGCKNGNKTAPTSWGFMVTNSASLKSA